MACCIADAPDSKPNKKREVLDEPESNAKRKLAKKARAVTLEAATVMHSELRVFEYNAPSEFATTKWEDWKKAKSTGDYS